MSKEDIERDENQECYECGTGIDTALDDHFVLTEEPRPFPEKEDMEFDDWFRSNFVFCSNCAPNTDCDMQVDTIYLVEERPIDPHYPPHVVAVYANEENALNEVDGDANQSVRETTIEDIGIEK